MPYHRYHIETRKAANLVDHPHRFNVKVSKLALAKLLIKEIVHYRGNKEVIISRPCVYGVFSGPIGGFAPREKLCVGCLRCTTQYPEVVQIYRNPARDLLGDSYFTPELVDTVVQESESGRVPIKGAGYRGVFGGDGWDGMWTDMSEIVRPTRDGIHGREFISTTVDIGSRPPLLQFDEKGKSIGSSPKSVSIPLPILFDRPPAALQLNSTYCNILADSAKGLDTFAILPLESILKFEVNDAHVIPLVNPRNLDRLKNLSYDPLFIEVDEGDERLVQEIKHYFPKSLLIIRAPFDSLDLLAWYGQGVRVFHLTANYHGRGRTGEFVLELIRKAHNTFVKVQCRDEVTLLGSGGLIAAEHIPKGIICGLDAVCLDTPPLVAMQARFGEDSDDWELSKFELPKELAIPWGKQRLINLAGSWRDQLLEILGAMGLREVRRLRGEMGRAMMQKDLEKEAFKEIAGDEKQ